MRKGIGTDAKPLTGVRTGWTHLDINAILSSTKRQDARSPQ